MTSHYQIIRYVPDPIADERINLGLIVYGEGRSYVRFVSNWNRLRTFGGESIEFLREFAAELQDGLAAQQDYVRSLGPWNEERMVTVARIWRHTIQFSEPRASLKTPQDLMSELQKKILGVPKIARRVPRTKSAVVKMARERLSAAFLPIEGLDPDEVLLKGETIEGNIDTHRFDIVVSNGRPLYAANCISFQVAEWTAEKQFESTAWAVVDASKSRTQTKFGVVALAPSGGPTKLYVRARNVLSELGAEFVTTGKLRDWAGDLARRLARRLA